MLDQNITTLLAALIGGLLSAIGGFLANYYIQSSSNQIERRKNIRNLAEQIYRSVQNIKHTFRDLSIGINDKDIQNKSIIRLTDEIDEIGRRIYLYMPSIQASFDEYKDSIHEILKTAIDGKDKSKKSIVDVDALKHAENLFLASLRELLKKKGYNYF